MISVIGMAGFKLALAIAGFLGFRAALKWMDLNSDFINTVKGWDDGAQAGYYGLRLIAVALVIGGVVG